MSNEMQDKIKIGVVEDERMMAEFIVTTLENLDYNPTKPASTFEAAIKMIEEEKPDIILLDIFLDSEKDGIDVAEVINKEYKLPFIFLTANATKETLERAKKVSPPAFLVKPFTNNDLYCAIEICLNNFVKPPASSPENSNFLMNDSIFIKDGYYFYKIKYNDIYYIESDHVYINIYTALKKLTIRASLGNFMENLNKDIFSRVHRSFIVNLNHIESITTDYVVVKGIKVPTSKKYKEEILMKFQII
jgi:two-component system response regulator LytT